MRVLGEIKTIKDWEQFGGPVSNDQWVDGRSAKELAKAWIGEKGPRIPKDFRKLLDSHDVSHDLLIGDIFPEARLTFDDCGGNVRNSDLAFLGTNANGSVAVTVEAKADEPFGNYSISEEIEIAKQTLIKTPNSRKLERINGLLEGLIGQSVEELTEEVGALRYQLFTALAGTLAYAKEHEAQAALMIVHVFRTDLTTTKKIGSNTRDYHQFLEILGRTYSTSLSDAAFQGPFQIEGQDRYLNPPPFYFAKLETDLRSVPT